METELKSVIIGAGAWVCMLLKGREYLGIESGDFVKITNDDKGTEIIRRVLRAPKEVAAQAKDFDDSHRVIFMPFSDMRYLDVRPGSVLTAAKTEETLEVP